MDFHPYYKNSRKRTYCKSAIDIPFPDEFASELETLLKDAERDGLGYRRTALTSTIQKQEDESHTAVLRASTLTLDGDAEVVVPAGINLKLFRKNPVICYAHNYETLPPVAKALWARVEDSDLKAKVKFAKRPADYPPVEFFPETIFTLVEQGILKGVSVGYIPIPGFCGPPTTKELDARPELVACKAVIRKAVLTEISIVPVPCNPDAVVESVTKGLVSRESLAFLGLDFLDQEDCWEWETQDLLPVTKAPTNSRLDLLKRAFPLNR